MKAFLHQHYYIKTRVDFRSVSLLGLVYKLFWTWRNTFCTASLQKYQTWELSERYNDGVLMESKTSSGWLVRAGSVEVKNQLNLLKLGRLLLCRTDAVLLSGLTGSPDQRAALPDCVAVFFFREKKENAVNFSVKDDLEEETVKTQILSSCRICYTPATLVIRQ